MSMQCALVLGVLLQKQRRSKSEFFPCSSAWVQNYFGFTPKQGKYVFAQLKEGEYLAIRMIGNPAKRHVCVNVDRCVADMCEYMQEVDTVSPYKNVRARGYKNVRATRAQFLLLKNIKNIKQVAACNDVTKCADASYGLLQQDNSKVEFENLAKQLHAILSKKRMIKKLPAMSQWATQFEALHTKDNVSLADVRQVLDWYATTCGGKYVIKACSAQAFRKRFDELYAAMQSAKPTEIVVSPQAKRITDRLRVKGWPTKALDELPSAITTSIEYIRQLLQNLATLRKRNELENKRMRRTAEVCIDKIGDVHLFVESWFSHVHQSIKNWSNWSGSLEPYTLGEDCTKFNLYMSGLLKAWCGDAERWNTLRRNIYAN
jgi:hypothetical protein